MDRHIVSSCLVSETTLRVAEEKITTSGLAQT
jgi:hypothetical protein